MAGAGGGSGACSRRPGRGAVLKTRLFLEKGYLIGIVSIGHKGTSACDTNPSHPVCQLDEMSEGFQDQCLELLLNTTDPEELLSDGGGGGGGATVLTIDSGVLRLVQLLSGGGGGSSASPLSLNSIPSDASVLTNPSEVIHRSGFGSTNMSAGVGAALFGAVVNYPSDGGGFDSVTNLDAIGGQDCLLDSESAFPRTVGGYGGGGGGCGNGGGGGGYIGGNVTAEGHQYPGGGGSSAYVVLVGDDVYSVEFDGYNEGNGFVEVFLEGCDCVYDCIPDFQQELFQCICPEGTRVSPFDCIEGTYIVGT